MWDEHIHNLICGLAVAFVIPAVTFAFGWLWSNAIGGWRGDSKWRRWWTTFCLAMPFICFGMILQRMAEDQFEGLRESWSSEPFALLVVAALTLLLSATDIFGIWWLWRRSTGRTTDTRRG
jgi:hypothetical protein